MPFLITLQLLLGAFGPRQPTPPPRCYVAPYGLYRRTGTGINRTGTGIDTILQRGAKGSIDAVIQAFTGIYDVVQITTEGASPAVVARYVLRIFPTEPAAYCRWETLDSPCQDSTFVHPVVAHKGATLRSSDSLLIVQRRVIRKDVFDMQWNGHAHTMTLSNAHGIDGPGDFLEVDDVTPDGFSGRWMDGSNVMPVFSRDDVPVAEQVSGYYCAWRRKKQ